MWVLIRKQHTWVFDEKVRFAMPRHHFLWDISPLYTPSLHHLSISGIKFFIWGISSNMEPQLSEEHGVRIAVEGCVCFDRSSTTLWCFGLQPTGPRYTSRNLRVYWTSMCCKRLVWSRPTHHRRWFPGIKFTQILPRISTTNTELTKNSQYEMHMIYNVYPCQQNTATCTTFTNTTLEHAKHPT